MKKTILVFIFSIITSTLFANNNAILNRLPKVQDNSDSVFNFYNWNFGNNYYQRVDVSTWDFLFARIEMGNFPSLSVGYSDYWGEVYMNGGYGMVGGLIGDMQWGGGISIGGRLSFHDLEGLTNYENAASMGFRYGRYLVKGYQGGGIYFDAAYSHRNWDYFLGFSFGNFGDNVHIFGEDDGTFMTIVFGIGYNFHSKKYWDHIKEKHKGSSIINSTPSITSTYTSSSRVNHTKPCPYHPKSGPYSEYSLKLQLDIEDDGIVGIYEDIVSSGYRLGVIKYNNSYKIIYLSGGNNKCWEFGHVKAELKPSATTGLFKGTWYMADFSANGNCLVTFDGVLMDVVVSGEETIYMKMYPTDNNSVTQNKPERWSGTCWALGNGYLVTNNHVIEDAHSITISGIKGDFNSTYSAEVIATDIVNDIAILRINDNRFSGFGAIPYSVTTRLADVGESVFVLGYPLTQTMGDEIKLTNGIISARTGFQGDAALYQMSAPIQPGNSGGPLFDNKGNIIGIVVAHYKGAENVGYAIKTSYLKKLIEKSGLEIRLPYNNTISTLSLPEKVKRLKKFVYYIECNK